MKVRGVVEGAYVRWRPTAKRTCATRARWWWIGSDARSSHARVRAWIEGNHEDEGPWDSMLLPRTVPRTIRDGMRCTPRLAPIETRSGSPCLLATCGRDVPHGLVHRSNFLPSSHVAAEVPLSDVHEPSTRSCTRCGRAWHRHPSLVCAFPTCTVRSHPFVERLHIRPTGYRKRLWSPHPSVSFRVRCLPRPLCRPIDLPFSVRFLSVG